MRILSAKRLVGFVVSLGLALGLSSIGTATTALAAPPATITLTTHYHRDACDYDGYNLFLWKNVDAAGDVSVDQTPTDQFNFIEGATDSYGKTLTTTVSGMNTFKDLGFIVRYSASPGAWTSKDTANDRFINFDGVASKEIWLIQGDATVYTSKPTVSSCGPTMISAVVDSFRAITVTLNQELALTGSGDEGFTLDKGLTVASVTALNGTASSASKLRLNLTSDVTIGTRYTVTHTGVDVDHTFGSKATSTGAIMNSQDFNDRYTYTGDDLGNTYTPQETKFRVWAPTANAVSIQEWPSATTGPAVETAMTEDVNGTWVATISGDKAGMIYTYKVDVNGHNNMAVDPYARTVTANGDRGVVIDLAASNPTGFATETKPVFSGKATDAIIYETHVRDLSKDASSGIPSAHRGKFLGLTDMNTSYSWSTTVTDPKTKKKVTTKYKTNTGVSAIKDLGVTHVQLLPIYDFASGGSETSPIFNWGYDPKNYNAPEGQYSTDPTNPVKRVNELKQAVQALHSNNLRVVMDVVYNHVASAGDFSMEQIVPGYFFRYTPSGEFENGTGCGNEVASEHPMVRKFIVDSVKYWASQYHLDGFRFDLMGILDVTTMQQVRAALDEVDPSILVIGEGWNMGALPEANRATQKNIASLTGIGAFNDQIRDAIKGSVFDAKDKGYAQGDLNRYDDVRVGIVGNIAYSNAISGNWTTVTPGQSVNYVEAHDNLTLYDKLKASMPKGTSATTLASTHRLAGSIFLLSQGLPFMQAGQEFLRSKDGDENSYQSSDAVNSIKWKNRTLNASSYNYYKGLIALRKAHPAFRMDTAQAIRDNLKFNVSYSGIVSYSLNGTAVQDTWSSIFVGHNPSKKAVSVKLPTKGTWYVVVSGSKAGVKTITTLKNVSTVSIPAGETIVLHK